MKKAKYILIIIVFLSGFLHSQATNCVNWIRQTTVFHWGPPLPEGCEIVLSYEYCCEATGFGFGIRIVGFSYSMPGCNTPITDLFWKEAVQAMMLDFVMKTNCIQPCSSGNWTQHVSSIGIPKCWKQINDPYLQECRIEACPSTTQCIYTYKVCYYYDQNNIIHLDYIVDSVYIMPGDNCTIIGVPEFSGDPNAYFETDCYIYFTDCPITN